MAASVSLNDIARRAKVSHVTVSNVLNRHGKEREVSQETAKLIRDLAVEMNYFPNLAARSLKTGKTHTIVLGTYSGLRYAYVNELIEEIHAKLTPHRYRLNLELLREVGESESVFRSFVRSRCDGVVFLETSPELIDPLELVRKRGMPLVTIGPFHSQRVDSVTYDHVEAARIGVEHLLGLGYRRVAFVLHQGGLSGDQFMRGHQLAHEEAGVPWDPELIVSWEVGANPDTLWPRLVELRQRPTALIVYNTELAAGLLQAIRRQKVRVPQEMALVTLGEAEIGRLVEVPLTTVDCANREIASVVVDRLLAQIKNPKTPARQVLVKPSLIVRESSNSRVAPGLLNA